MHISDGILSPAISIGGYALTVAISAWCVRRVGTQELPKISVVTSSFFAATLIHIPLGPTSVHLLLPGLVGILLGPLSFLSILIGLTLQFLFFQYGGLTSLGANALVLGVPAITCGWIFRRFRKGTRKWVIFFGAMCAIFGTVFAALLLAGLLATAGEDFYVVAKFALLAHIPVFIVEGAISACTISFLHKVRPELLRR